MTSSGRIYKEESKARSNSVFPAELLEKKIFLVYILQHLLYIVILLSPIIYIEQELQFSLYIIERGEAGRKL